MGRTTRGFTFVELVLVATIVAILCAIAIPNFFEAKIRGAAARSKADLMVIKLAVDAYRMENRMFPLNSVPGKASGYDLIALTTPVPYLTHLPSDVYTLPDTWSGHRNRRFPFPEPYRYYNAVQVSPEEGLEILGPRSFLFDGFVAAVIYGRGPGTRFTRDPGGRTGPDGTNVVEGEPFTEFLPDGKARLLVYESTNGSSSAGDIYRRLP